MLPKAYRIDELVAAGPFKRAWLYKQVSTGALPARRIDGVVFVLDADWNDFLANAPSARSITDLPPNEAIRSFDASVKQISRIFDIGTTAQQGDA